jgi:hypothetical protein
MLPVLEDYMERLQALRAAIQQVLEGLPPQALNWVPGQELFSCLPVRFEHYPKPCYTRRAFRATKELTRRRFDEELCASCRPDVDLSG